MMIHVALYIFSHSLSFGNPNHFSMTEFIERPILTEEHKMFQQSVRDFIAQEIVPHNAEWEKNHMVTRESWTTIGANGFLCMQVPEEYGGLGIKDFRYNAIFAEELSRAGVAGPAVGYPLLDYFRA